MGKPAFGVPQPREAQPVDCDRYSIKNVQIPGSKNSLSWLALLLILHKCTMKDQNFFHVHLVHFETDDQYFPTPPLYVQVILIPLGTKIYLAGIRITIFIRVIMYFSH